MRKFIMPQNTSFGRNLIKQDKEPMKRTLCTLCYAALALAFCLPALAAEKAAPTKNLASPVLEVKHPASTEHRPTDTQYADQPGQVMYQVLLAEIAIQRGEPVLASNIYADLALRTRDPMVLERTVEVSGYARRFDLAMEIARLWLDVDPTSKRAQQALASVMILSNQLDELAPNLVRMLELDKESLAENLLGLNRMFVRNPDRMAVFRLIDKVCRPFFGLAEAHYAVALAAGSAKEYERALTGIRRALELRPDWEMAALLEAQILAQSSPAEAIRFLKNFVERNPKAQDIQLHLARALVNEKRYSEAKIHFDQLLQAYPDRPEVLYPVAILALQQNDRVLAEAQLKHLLTLNVPDKNLANYYLGQIAEDDKRNDEALAYYTQIESGEQFLPARVRSAHILVSQGKYDSARQLLATAPVASPEERIQLLIAEAALLREAKQVQTAFTLLDDALISQPEQPDLLYETALLAEKLEKTDVLESRLRKLIKLQPESAQAYNALGYSFAERNLNLGEARELIEKALKLLPDDAFILDSLGWVLYRQGDLPGALANLEQAYAKRDDPEVAAHMGEVLWALGRKEDAQRLLNSAHQKYPDNEALTAATKKFVP